MPRGSRLPQVPTHTPTPRIAFSNHHVSVFLNTPMLLCHLLAHRMPLHLVWGWMRSPEGSVPSQPRTPGGGTHIFPRLRECTPGRGLAGPPHPALNSKRRGVYSPPQARCRAHCQWLSGPSTGDGPTLRVGPPPSASLAAAPPFGEAACQRSVAECGGSTCSVRPTTTTQPLTGSPALRGRRLTKSPWRREKAPPEPAVSIEAAGEEGKAKSMEPSKCGAPSPECCLANPPSWGGPRRGLRPSAAPLAWQPHTGLEVPWGASGPLQYSTVGTVENLKQPASTVTTGGE